MLTSGLPKNKVAKVLLKIAYGDTDSIDYDLYKSAGILIENGEHRALELILQEADSAPRDHIRKVISEKDPKLFNIAPPCFIFVPPVVTSPTPAPPTAAEVASCALFFFI